MMKRHRQPLQAMDAINVTNLLDTAFILLVTFMLVAPQLSHSVRVKLPEVGEGSGPTEPAKKEPILVVIQKRGGEADAEEHIYMKQGKSGKEERVDIPQLSDRIAKARADNPDLAVVVESDKDSSAGMLVRVFAVLSRANVQNISLPVNPEKAPAKPPVKPTPAR